MSYEIKSLKEYLKNKRLHLNDKRVYNLVIMKKDILTFPFGNIGI